MGVERLQRIIRPLDQLDAHRESRAALRQLEQPPQAGGAGIRHHAEHVRPLCGYAALPSGNRVHEPVHLPRVVEGAEQNAAALHRDDEHGRRDDVLGIGVAPDLLFERDDLAAIVERCERADHDCGPATATAARAGSSTAAAASLTSSSVTAWRLPGSRLS